MAIRSVIDKQRPAPEGFEQRKDAHDLARASQHNAAELARRAAEHNTEAGGRYAAFRGKQFAPLRVDALARQDGRGMYHEQFGLEVLNEAMTTDE